MIDTHAHLDDKAFDTDREEVLAQCVSAGVTQIIDAASSPESLDQVLDLAEEHACIYAAVGIHPEYAGFISKAKETCETYTQTHAEGVSLSLATEQAKNRLFHIVSHLADNKKIVAIGEIGLDYHYEDGPAHDIQQELFIAQIEIARLSGLPIEVHSRDACRDTLRILRETDAGARGCDMHCYSYSVESAREYLELGCYLGIGGVSTFSNARKLKEVIAYTPLDRLLLETDCPYLAPVPYRGKRNAPFMLPHVVNAIAEIKGISPERVIEETTANARRLFPRLCQEAT